eukprot:scaffold442_cov268-Pinguiococcus_pyrenoidosus.AAC.36
MPPQRLGHSDRHLILRESGPGIAMTHPSPRARLVRRAKNMGEGHNQADPLAWSSAKVQPSHAKASPHRTSTTSRGCAQARSLAQPQRQGWRV